MSYHFYGWQTADITDERGLTPRDYYDLLSKGTHVIETEYYIDRTGTYQTGTCTVQCAYAPEYTARTAAQTIHVE